MKEFEIVSGVIVASDPCYTIPTWCQGIVENVKKGTWQSKVEVSNDVLWGRRIASLTIVNKEAWEKDPTLDNQIAELYSSEPMEFVGGVDSGQFGFFDKDFYRNDESAEELEKYDFGADYDVEGGDKWYRVCSNLTLGGESWGVLPNGVVSSSGFGDGSYDVWGIKDENGEYVVLSVCYIMDEDYDEDYDDDFLMDEQE